LLCVRGGNPIVTDRIVVYAAFLFACDA
jgi:hypothetical protein